MKQTEILQEQLEKLLHEKHNLIPTANVQVAINDIIKIINNREKGTCKTREAEFFVDQYLEKFDCSPTYRVVQAHFKLQGVAAAHYRLRNYRHKMKQKQ